MLCIAVLEGEYLLQVARSRWPVLAFIFCFDIVCYLFRYLAKLISSSVAAGAGNATLWPTLVNPMHTHTAAASFIAGIRL